MIRLTLPLPPLGNRYKGFDVRSGRWYVTDEATRYKETVAGYALAAGLRETLAADIAISVTVYRKRKAGDLDGYSKVLLDAMEGCVYVNDSQVAESHWFRRDDKANPRVEVEILAL